MRSTWPCATAWHWHPPRRGWLTALGLGQSSASAAVSRRLTSRRCRRLLGLNNVARQMLPGPAVDRRNRLDRLCEHVLPRAGATSGSHPLRDRPWATRASSSPARPPAATLTNAQKVELYHHGYTIVRNVKHRRTRSPAPPQSRDVPHRIACCFHRRSRQTW